MQRSRMPPGNSFPHSAPSPRTSNFVPARPTVSYSPALSDWLLIVPACALLFVWSLPNTIALRLLIVVLLLALTLWQSRALGVFRGPAFDKSLWLVFLALSAWIVLQALLFAVHPELALKEIWGQWIRSGLTGLIGFLVARLVTRRQPDKSGPFLAMAMTATLVFQIGLHDADTLWRWWSEGQLPFQETRIVANRAGISFLTNLLMALLSAEVMARILYNRPYLPLSRAWLGGLFVMCGFTTYVVGTRYGTLGFVTLIASCIVVALLAKRHVLGVPKILLIVAVSLACLGTFGWMSVKSDPRWITFLDSIPVALDTEHQRAGWDDGERWHVLRGGWTGDDCARMRVAWGEAERKGKGDKPLGGGEGSKAKGQAKKWK